MGDEVLGAIGDGGRSWPRRNSAHGRAQSREPIATALILPFTPYPGLVPAAFTTTFTQRLGDLPSPAWLNEGLGVDAPAPMQRVEITGTNIRRAQAETASSVLTVNRTDIERSGKATVAELLQTLAVDNAGSVPVTFGSGFASGASGISLRGCQLRFGLVGSPGFLRPRTERL